MKIDIVNPMPAKQPINHKFNLEILFGKEQIFSPIPSIENKNIPKGFPNNKPKTIPSKFEFSIVEKTDGGNKIAVFASANKGNTINATGLCKKCCSLKEIEFSSPD